MAKRKRPAQGQMKQDDRLFALEACIISGPMTEKFVKKNKVISHTIQIRGAQTLEVFHYAMFGAFGREDEHMYEFQVGGKEPADPNARKYVLPMAMDDTFAEDKTAGDITRTAIGSLGLKAGDAFGYWFDFGDDWWHQINVVAIEDKPPRGVLPRVTKRIGESPPQYSDWDQE